MKLLLTLTILITTIACGPECKRGHQAPYQVGAYRVQDQPTVIRTGRHSSITIPHSHWVPAHTEYRWVCDEYEKAVK